MRNYTFRLKPGQDLFDSISLFVQENGIRAGCVSSGAGSLAYAEIRFANRERTTAPEGHFEIASIPGTVSIYALTSALSEILPRS